MALFDFLKSKSDKQSEKVAGLQQQIISLQEEVASVEKKKEHLQSQVEELEKRANQRTIEIDSLEMHKEKIEKEVDSIQSKYDRLFSLLQTSTNKVRSLVSSTEGSLADFDSCYLIALDENDFNELSSYYELKAENDSLILQKKECEQELRRVESATKILEDKSATLQHQFSSLQEQISAKELKKDELGNQIIELEKQVVSQKNELFGLQHNKELLKQEVYREYDEKIESKEEDLEFLENRLRETQDRINFAVCELKNIKTIKDSDFSISWNDNPTKEEKEVIVEKYNVLQLRYNLIKTWMDKYEKDIEQAKSDLDSYIKEHRNEIRNELIHELYQRTSQCESSMLRHLTSHVENADVEAIREELKYHNHIIKKGLLVRSDEDYSLVKYPLNPIYNMIEDFIQLNISDIVKEMKFSDWETIKMKASTVISNVQSILLGYTQVSFDSDYLNSVYNYLEAKYIAIQKQKLEREKEREEREAQREYERAIKKALKDEEKAQEALEQKKREIAEAQTQEKIQKLQEQIQGLEKALVEARELRERAMSMAQQTKIGYVYVISNIGSFGKDVYKIGMTRRLDPMERVLELSNASVPFPFDVHTFIYSEDAPALEADLHRIFDSKKVNSINYRKEYFHVTLDEIKSVLKEKGVDAKFVDEPDAFQYRESMMKEQQQTFFISNSV